MLPAPGAKCCAPHIPRQLGAGEHVVFTGAIVPKTLTLFLQRSTKYGAPYIRTVGSTPAILAGTLAVRSTIGARP